LKTDGSAWAMGRDTDGEQGNGPDLLGDRPVPVRIASGVSAVAAGAHHTVLLKSDGTIWTAGLNNYGQLGDGTYTSRNSLTQVAIEVSAIACDGFGTLDDSVRGISPHSSVVGTGIVSIASGVEYAMFVTREGQLHGWGSNSHGQYGTGSTESSPTPIPLGTAYAVACGDYHSAVLVLETSPAVAANATGRAATIPDPDGDSDGDGLSNLIEHAFASNPLAPGETPYSLGLQATESGSALVLTHRRLIGAAVDFIYEWSDDLGEWQAFTPQLQVQPVDAEVEKVIVTRSIVPGEPAGFLRVRVLEK
jgi:alpha-tubulin suppressor-like RCC1 family protein